MAGGNAPFASTATLEPPTEPTDDDYAAAVQQDDDPSSEDVLKTLAGLFSEASSQKSGREKAINEALEVLGKLDPFKYPDIANNETVMAFIDKVQQQRAQSEDVPPGTIIGTGMAAFKKPWTKNDLLKSKGMPVEEARAKGLIEWIEYTPFKNMDVTWQGIRIVWPARRRVYIPKSHVDVFEQSMSADEWNERHAAWLFNNPDVPFEADFNNMNAARLRAMDESKGEYYKPGAGLIAMAPSPELLDNTNPEG